MSKRLDEGAIARVVGCRSDYEIGSLLGNIDIDGFPGLTVLDAASLKSGSPDVDAKAKRFELINVVRGGKHVELSVTARTFRQRKAPNRRHLRLGAEKFPARAKTWANQPFLVDHNTYEMAASKGTILVSKAVEEDGGVYALEQTFHVVKPDAVIGFLDGTFNKFSVGWFPVGEVLCTAHGTPIHTSCHCWPGQQVLVDGKAKIAEYEFSDYEGKEMSAVVIPAVRDVSVSEIQAALAAELSITYPTQPNPLPTTKPHKETGMRFYRLAAILGLTLSSEASETSDEATLLTAVEALKQRTATVETQLADKTAKLAQAETALAAVTDAGVRVQVDTILATEGYGIGKLKHGRGDDGKPTPSPREVRLRKIAKADGIEALRAELAEMEVVVPVGQRMQSKAAGTPPPTALGEATEEISVDNPYMKNAAQQLGLKVEDMVSFATDHVGV